MKIEKVPPAEPQYTLTLSEPELLKLESIVSNIEVGARVFGQSAIEFAEDLYQEIGTSR